MSNLCLPSHSLSHLHLLQLKKDTEVSSFPCFVWQRFIYFNLAKYVSFWSSCHQLYTQLIQSFLVGLVGLFYLFTLVFPTSACSKWPECNNGIHWSSFTLSFPCGVIALPIFVQLLPQHRLVWLALLSCSFLFKPLLSCQDHFESLRPPSILNNCAICSQIAASTYF